MQQLSIGACLTSAVTAIAFTWCMGSGPYISSMHSVTIIEDRGTRISILPNVGGLFYFWTLGTFITDNTESL